MTATADNAANDDCAEGLRVSFANAAQFTLMGQRMEGISRDDGNRITTRWTQVVGRHAIQMADPAKAQVFKAWMTQFDGVRAGSDDDKLKAVNARVEKNIMYEGDDATYQSDDFWATPVETILNRQGDCEDLAIVRFYTLLALGVAPEKVFVAIVDSSGGNPGGHAPLIFDGAVSESYAKAKTPTPKGDEQPPRAGYTLYYAMNMQGIWRAPERTEPVWGTPAKEPQMCVRGLESVRLASR